MIANTKDLGITTVQKRIYLVKSNAVLFYGIEIRANLINESDSWRWAKSLGTIKII